MKRLLKKSLALLLVLTMVLGAAPLAEFVGLDSANIFSIKATATGAKVDDSDYSYMAQIILNYNYNGAASLVGNTTLPNMRLNRFMNPSICSVSRPTVEELNSNATFVVSANLWKAATFDLSEVLSAAEEEVGYYQAIILNVLNSTIQYSIVPSTVKSYTKNIITIQKNIDKYKIKGLDTALGVNLWDSQLTPDEALELYNNLEAERVKVNKRITNYSDASSIINGSMTVLNVIEKFASDAAVADMSENIKLVIDELYANCPGTNVALKAALLEVKTVIKSTLDRIGVDLANAVWQAGRVAINTALNELWVGFLESVVGELTAGILIGQVIGKAVCNMMFSVDSTIEQWYKLSALVEFENVMYSTINSLGNKFKGNPNEENALVFLSAIELLGNMYIEDYNMSEDLVEYVYEKGLWNNIKKAFLKIFNKYDNSEVMQYHEDIKYLKGAVNDLYEITNPDFYSAWMTIDKGITPDNENSNQSMAKVVSVKCPTDVEIYDSNSNLLVSIHNDEIERLALDVYVDIVDSEKTIYLSDYEEYSVKIIATDNGTMDYSVTEVENGLDVRNVVYEDVPLNNGESYTSSMSLEKYENVEKYDLKCEDGTIVKSDFDSLPPIENNIVDTVVAEELFEGFSKELIDKVANAMFSFEPIVNIANFNISTDDTVALFSAVSKYYPTEYSLLTKGDFSYKIIFSPSLKCITDIRFYYGEDANLDAFERRTKELNAEIEKIVAQVDGMSDFEKALYIHDYIVLNSEYDLELLELLESGGTLSGELYSEKYSEYSILINGTGICGSYALAYRALMNAAGVECLYLSSQQMNHAWNMVKIDGEWYHVDCCWDDPVPDTFGMARRQYFLRTDEEIMELNHYSWVPGTYQATSKKYSDMPRSSDYTQKFDNGYWYYVSYGNVYKANQYGKSEEIIAESLFPSSISYKNGELYYSKGIYIYRYDVNSGKSVIAAFLHSDECGDNSSKAYIKNLYVDESAESASIYKNIYINNVNRTVKSTVLIEEDKYSKVTGITISESEAEIELFGNLRLNAEIQSSGSTNGLGIKWTSSNNTVASVNSGGYVTALNVGKAVITAECVGFIAECEVSVTGDGLSGACGTDNSGRWYIDPKTFCLTISGENAMEGYSNQPKPWDLYESVIKSVLIDNDVKSLCHSAFGNYVNIESVTIGNSVTSIDSMAFYNCTGLTSVTIGNSVTSIGDLAFYNCTGLTSITIPDGVTSFENNAFSGCTRLVEIKVDLKNQYYSNDSSGVLFDKNKTTLLLCPSGKEETDYTIPDSVTSIDNYAFSDCTGLTSVTIPDSVISIGDGAFECCKGLTSITIPDNVTSIGDYAFDGCAGLTSITIPDGVTSIGDSAFKSCVRLTSITIPDSVTRIGSSAFNGCTGIKNVTIPDSVTSIGSSAFSNCTGLTSVTIPESVESIGNAAFLGCISLTNIEVDSNNTTYSSDSNGVLFDKSKTTLLCYPAGKEQTEYIIPDGVTSIGNSAFYMCSGLLSIEIPNSVTIFGNNAFYGCTGLTSFAIPESVTNINSRAFEECTGLSKFTVDFNNQYFSSDSNGVLLDKSKTTLLHYPAGKEQAEYIIPDGITGIGSMAFNGCSKLTNIIIPDSVSNIGIFAFYRCYSLTSIEIPQSITAIKGYAFAGCTGLKSIIIPKSVTYIDIWAFTNCANICHVGYTGSAEEWNLIEFKDGNKPLLSAKHIHFNFDPETDISLCESTEATCTNSGYTSGEYCIDCETWISGHDVIPAKGHNYELTSSVEGTCNTISSDTYTCTICKESYTKYGDLKEGHSYIETVTEPTCTEIGYTTAVCEICGESAMYDFVPMIGHDVTVTHTDADCTKCAQTEYSCKRCDYQTTIVDEKGGLGEHNISITKTEATCTEKGSIERVCVNCNQVISSEEIEAKGHVPGEWHTVTEATTDSSGMKEKRCTVCSELLDEEIIPKIPVNAFGVSLSETEVEITNKSSHQLNAIISPENADDKTVAWASDNESVATVDENGLVTAVSIGKATITVTTGDGGFTATCKVTVNPRKFNVTWIADGVETTNAEHEYGTIALPDNPIKEGYTFTGWTPEVPDTMPSEDLTFTATWKANNYDAVFDANGGKWADGSTEKTFSTEYDSEIVSPESPEKQGYIFSGWTPKVGVMDDINGKEFNALWIAATDTRYTVETYTMNTLGKYEKSVEAFTGETDSTANAEYTVEPGFSLNSEKSVLSGKIAADNSLALKVYIDRNTYSFTTVVDGVSESSDYLYGSMVSEPAIPSKTGYTFTGWSSEIPETMPANDVTVEAEWQVNSYTVTWITDGTEAKTAVTYGAKIGTPATPVKAGYEFIGWDKQIPETMPAYDLTFTAQFKCITTVSIKNNPGTKTIKYGETLKLTAITTNMPTGANIYWYVDGVKKAEGETFEISPKNGSVEITVEIVDANGNALVDKNGNEIQDSEKVSVNSGLWQKIVSFFKNLFRMNRTVVQAIFKGTI